MTDSKKQPLSMRSGWIVCVAVLGALMLTSGLFFMRFDMTVSGQGIVEAKTTHRLFSPREAWLERVEVEPGREVAPGEVLLRLRDEGLEREILLVREALLASRAESRRAALLLRELEVTQGGAEALRAPRALEYHARRAEVLDELREMYQALLEKGSASRMEILGLEGQRVNARLEALRDETLMGYYQSGALEMLREQHQLTLDLAEERSALLEERLEVLREERSRLRVTAPVAGRVTDVYTRDPGMALSRGDPLLALADPRDGYWLRLTVHDRNVDLIRPGQSVRLDSRVYPSAAEGYAHGEVLNVVTDTRASEAGGFEVWVAFTSWPVEPVIGSRVSADILLRRQGVLSLLVPRASRQNPRDEFVKEELRGP